MAQQDLRSFQSYMLGVLGLVVALFIPFSALVLKIFQPLVAAVFLGIFIPFVALLLGIVGLIKSSKQSLSVARTAKILNIVTIIVSVILIAFNVYVFIKSGGLTI